MPVPRRTWPKVGVPVSPVPPKPTATAVPCHVPDVSVPTLVREDAVTPEPRAVDERTSVPLI